MSVARNAVQEPQVPSPPAASPSELSAAQLHFHPALTLDFRTTEDLAPLRDFTGQERAKSALELGLGITCSGFHIVISELTGRQGVLIPAANVRHLLLRADVIEAVAQGKFHLYPIRTVDEGIALLTGVRAGTIAEEGTVNWLVKKRLRELATDLKEFAPRVEFGESTRPVSDTEEER